MPGYKVSSGFHVNVKCAGGDQLAIAADNSRVSILVSPTSHSYFLTFGATAGSTTGIQVVQTATPFYVTKDDIGGLICQDIRINGTLNDTVSFIVGIQ